MCKRSDFLKQAGVTVLLLCFVFATNSVAAEKKKKEVKKTDYYTLVAQLKKGDRSADIKALRMAYTRTPEYRPYGGDDAAREEMYDALKSKKQNEAIALAQRLLDRNYADLEAHLICKIAYREKGEYELSEFHQHILKELLASIYDSGDGTSPDTAYVVISPQEEYFILTANGLKTIKSTSISFKNHRYDKLELEHEETNNKSVIYFNIDVPYAWLSRKIQ